MAARGKTNMLTASAGAVPDGTIGIDQDVPLNAASAAAYVKQGYGFAVRYVGRNAAAPAKSDLTAAEVQILLTAGLAVGVVQHPLAPGWKPDGASGQSYGAAAAALVKAIGLPAGMHVWVDLEGTAPGTVAQDAIDYCAAWAGEVTAAGYLPGIYIGAAPALTADQLYWDVPMKSYWQGGSSARSGVPVDIPHRGYAMRQRPPVTKNDAFDRNVTHADNFGGKVMWCVAAA